MRKQKTKVVCPQGHEFEADVYRSANVTQAPNLRDEIESGQFNWTTCSVCGERSYADVPFLYHDMGSALRVWVYPERDRPAEDEILEKIRRAAAIANTVLPTDRSGPELVFGLDDLRDLIKAPQSP
jgi:hypothetical protein